jgi:hypothetical protein
MDMIEAGWKDVEWIHLAQYKGEWQAVVDTGLSLRFTSGLY